AQKRVDDYAKVKDASASVLNRLIRLCLRLGLYEEALDWSVVFHRSFPQDARSRLLAAETLTFFDDRDALKAQIQECLEAEDCRIQAGALGLIAKWQLDSLEDQAVFIEQWWRDIPECPYDLDSFLRTGAEDSSSTLSVGVFLGDLCVHSPAQWFLNAFPCFHHTSTQFTIYIDGADHWGREYFRSYRYDVVETDEIDTETLCCIMVRNGHQTILDLSNFSQHSRLDALVHMSGRRRVGLVNHTAHLAQKDRLGFDAVIVSDEDVQSSATCHALRDLAFIPPALVQQWSPREAEDFVIVLALLPNQVSSVLPSIVALLQLDERIRLSIDQTLCGERGLNILAAGLRRHNVADYEERVVLFSQSDFRHLDEIGEHLCTGDVYLSFGMTGYDFVALERRVPIVIAPEVQLSYGGHSRAVLENFDLPMMHPVDSPTFIGTIKNWLSHPDAWSDWYTEYQRQCQNLSEPAHHFERILKVQNLMFPKNS
ncbi:MAG: hypothetical protein HRT36_04295, partial [Alphaproteobacteria bacterium]|nr:hypothetical protein [Alphaproteobacteria bacterium]